MLDLNNINKIYISPGYTDLRMGIDEYAALVEEVFGKNPFDISLYLFCNKTRDKIKILHFEHDGFWLYYKRIEKGHIKWPNKPLLKEIEIRQFRWLFD